MKNRSNFSSTWLVLLAFVLSLFGTLLASQKKEKRAYRVYQYVVERAQGDFEQISDSLEAAFQAAGWQVVAKVDAGVPEGCPYRARVFVLFDSTFAYPLLDANPLTAPFAILDRVNLFEDENGIHVSVVNPHSIVRTVMMDDWSYEELCAQHLHKLRKTILSAVEGQESRKSYGQLRKKGKIGKTMGVMAGGDFDGKIEEVATIAKMAWKEVAEKVREGLSQKSPKWGMHVVFELPLPRYRMVLFGTTGTPMDSKSFSIVKAGSDKSRKKLQCPGLAHAAAYPIEVLVVEEDGLTKVKMIDEMYRMKMYFEDAGKMAFMKNMGMPGSIEGEIKQQILTGLGMARSR